MNDGSAAEVLMLMGRVLLGGPFVFAGVRHFFVMPAIIPQVEARGVPAPRLVISAGSIFEIAAGLCLVLGLFIVPAALGLIVFTIAASVMLLNFWDAEGPPREGMMLGCLSNVAIVGGLLMAAASGMQ